jgi:hypothetical protein
MLRLDRGIQASLDCPVEPDNDRHGDRSNFVTGVKRVRLYTLDIGGNMV